MASQNQAALVELTVQNQKALVELKDAFYQMSSQNQEALAELKTDMAFVRTKVEANSRHAQQAAALMSGRQSTDAWLARMRAAPVDMVLLASMVSSLEDIGMYQTLWTALWAHFDSLARTDATFNRTLTELRARSVFDHEDKTQALFNQAIPWLIQQLDQMLGCAHVFRNTSSSHAPLQPQHKFDMSFVCKDAISANQDVHVIWTEFVMTAQLKRDLNDSTARTDAFSQIADGFCELHFKQKDRDREFAFISDAREFQIFVRTFSGDVEEIFTSGSLPLFTPNEPRVTTGFASLVNLFVTSAKMLGYSPCAVASVLPPILPDGFLEEGVSIIPHRTGHKTKPDVFFVGQVRALAVFFTSSLV